MSVGLNRDHTGVVKLDQVRRADARQGDPPHGKSFGGTTFGVPPYEIWKNN